MEGSACKDWCRLKERHELSSQSTLWPWDAPLQVLLPRTVLMTVCAWLSNFWVSKRLIGYSHHGFTVAFSLWGTNIQKQLKVATIIQLFLLNGILNYVYPHSLLLFICSLYYRKIIIKLQLYFSDCTEMLHCAINLYSLVLVNIIAKPSG